MWVRSQDQTELFQYIGFYIDGRQIKGVIAKENTKYNILGEYETEERALQVLNSIHNTIVYNQREYTMPDK